MNGGTLSHMTRQKQNGLLFHVLDVFLNIVLIAGIIVGIRTFLVSPFQVEGNSMTSTLEDKEYIIINKLAYYIGHPQRGDIVVFYPPHEEEKKYYVKRIIGLPGDDVVIQNGKVYVRKNGDGELEVLDEEYIDERNLNKTFPQPHGGDPSKAATYTVPQGHYFVLGDNRQGSLDSRSFVSQRNMPLPYVPEESIKGRVWFIALPMTKIHAFEAPDYGI